MVNLCYVFSTEPFLTDKQELSYTQNLAQLCIDSLPLKCLHKTSVFDLFKSSKCPIKVKMFPIEETVDEQDELVLQKHLDELDLIDELD